MSSEAEQATPAILERKLVTILSADVAEYSRLMAEDEEHTLRVFRDHSGTFRALVDLHHGRIFNTAGDAILAEFNSPVEAVRCATDIQAALRSRNDLLLPSRQVKFRIGVNLGDVMMQDQDLMGDGVNVASRLQGAAEPGGICLSGSVYDQIRNKLSLSIESLGERRFKNIPQPVRTFTIAGTEGRSPGAKTSPRRIGGVVLASVVTVGLLVLAGGYGLYNTHQPSQPDASNANAGQAIKVASVEPGTAPAPIKTITKPVTSSLEIQSSALLADATQLHRPQREIQALTDANTKIAALAGQLHGLGKTPDKMAEANALTAQMKSLAADMARKETAALARAGRAMVRDFGQPPAKPATPDAAAIAAVAQAKGKLDDAVAAAQQAQDESVSLAAARQAVAAFDAYSTASAKAVPVYVLARRNDFAAAAAAVHAVGDNLVALGKVSRPFFLASRARKDAYNTLTENAAQVPPQLAELDELGRGAVAGNDLGKINAALTQTATIKVKLDGLLASSNAASALYNK